MIFSQIRFLALSLLVLLGASFDLFGHDSGTPKIGQKLTQEYLNNLEKKEKILQSELFTMVDIKNENEWLELKNNLKNEYFRACEETTRQELSKKPLPQKIIGPIYEVLNNRKIRNMLNIVNVEKSPKNQRIIVHRTTGTPITIARGNKSIEADAATDQFTVLVDPEVLLDTHANGSEIKATIAHELVHIAHQDDFNVYCVNQIYKSRKKTCKTPKKRFARVMGQWERLQEERADLLSGLINIEYAIANRNHFKRNMPKKEKLKEASSHPTDRQRYTYMANLVTTMEQKQKNYGDGFLLLITLLVLFIILSLGTKKIKNSSFFLSK